MNQEIQQLNSKDFEYFLASTSRFYLSLSKNQTILDEIHRRLIEMSEKIGGEETLSYLIYNFAGYYRRIVLEGNQQGNSEIENDALAKTIKLLGKESGMRMGDKLLLISTLLGEDDNGNIIIEEGHNPDFKSFRNKDFKNCVKEVLDHFASDYEYGSMYSREDHSLLGFILFNNVVEDGREENTLNSRIRSELESSIEKFPPSFKKSILKSFVEFSYIKDNRLPLLTSMKMTFVKYIDPIVFLEKIPLNEIDNFLLDDLEEKAVVDTYLKLSDEEKEILDRKVAELRRARSERSLREVLVRKHLLN